MPNEQIYRGIDKVSDHIYAMFSAKGLPVPAVARAESAASSTITVTVAKRVERVTLTFDELEPCADGIRGAAARQVGELVTRFEGHTEGAIRAS